MTNWNPRANNLFLKALELPAPSHRQQFLSDACASDAALRAEVDALLDANAHAGEFLESPAANRAHTLESPAFTERIGSVIGPYKLMEQIGEGGMGLVYVAEQSQPVRRKVALKLIKPGMDTRQVIARFEAERQALALMNHANIAKVFDGGETPSGRPYFVMEFVKGVPITEYCDAHRLTPRARLELFGQVCAAVQHAHQKGIIHRDIKPSNVIVSSHDGTPVVKVIDFGVAKAIGQQLTDKTVYTQVAQFIGTPLYMSPEQAGQSDLDIDTRTDVYALGVLLYELLTGTTPFDKDRLSNASYDEIRRLIREEEPPKPSTRVSTLNAQSDSTLSSQRQSTPRELSLLLRGELDWIVMKSLEKDRNRRYESANALAADLERYLKDEPVQACPPSRRYLLGKFLRRHRTGVLTTVAVLAAALVVAVGSGYLVIDRANRLSTIEQKVNVALGGARTAIEAGDLALARQRVAQAHAYLETERERLPAWEENCNGILKEIEDRQADETRLRQFFKLANEAQDKMGFDEFLGGDEQAKEALALFGVLEGDDWLARLDSSYLTASQKEQIRVTAYVTLVSMAEAGLRLASGYTKAAHSSLDLLQRAEGFHAPTRAFYFVRGECHRVGGNTAAAAEDLKRFHEARAQTAWDQYLPGRAADRHGDYKEAIRAYRAALELQRDHYNSLFFLARVFAREKIKRFPEAIQLYTACSALRRDHVFPYVNSAVCYLALGQLEEAEAAYAAAIAAPTSEIARAWAHNMRQKFYKHIGNIIKAQEDEQRAIKLYEQVAARPIIKHDRETLLAMDNLGNLYCEAGRLQDGIAQHSQTLAIRKAVLGPDDPHTLDSMNHLALAYDKTDQSAKAVELVEQSLEIRKAKLGPDHPDTIKNLDDLASVLTNTAVSHLKSARWPEAIALLQNLLVKREAKHGPHHPETLRIIRYLARAYQEDGKVERADHLFRDLLERTRHKDGAKAIHDDDLLASLGTYLLKQQLYDEAEPLLRECLAIREKQKPEDWRRFNTLSQLGGALLGKGNCLDAEPLLLEGYEGMKQREETIPSDGRVRVTEAIERIVRLYEATEQDDKAFTWREKLTSAKSKADPVK